MGGVVALGRLALAAEPEGEPEHAGHEGGEDPIASGEVAWSISWSLASCA